MTENDLNPKDRFKTPPGYWQARKPALKGLAHKKAPEPKIISLWQRSRGLPWLAAALLTGLALYVWQVPDEEPTAPLPPEAILTYLQAEAIPAGEISAQEPPEIKALFQESSAPVPNDGLHKDAITQYLKAQNPENILL